MPPYSFYPIEKALNKCCGNCTKLRTKKYFANISEVTPLTINSSDFVLLFLGSSSAVTLYSFYFLPVIYAPSVFYITHKGVPILQRLFTSCLSLYPLIVICLLMAVISGFMAWIMETWNNEEEFPRPFFIGWFEGFWWGFVSMTTVGYGDKTPKSFFARVFSIIWILIGVALFSIFTALLTTAIMQANNPKPPGMRGANVGVLKYREYDASIIAKNGGNLIESSGWDFQSDTLQLIAMLRKKEIDGVLFDKYTLSYVSTIFEEMLVGKENTYKKDIEYFLNETSRTEKLTGEKYSFGILVKYYTDYEYFRSAIVDNRLTLETGITLYYNTEKKKIEEDVLFSPSGPLFLVSVTTIVAIIGGICAFGICFELWRRHMVLCQLKLWKCNVSSCSLFEEKGEQV